MNDERREMMKRNLIAATALLAAMTELSVRPAACHILKVSGGVTDRCESADMQ